MTEIGVNELDHWNGTQKQVLLTCLQVAVPLLLAELRALGEVERRRRIDIWARDASEPLASGGDRLFNRLRDYPGEPGSAKTFNHLARAVASLSTHPGGIEMYGRVFCATHSPGGAVGEFVCTPCRGRWAVHSIHSPLVSAPLDGAP